MYPNDMYIPGLTTSGSQWNAKSVIDGDTVEDVFTPPDMPLMRDNPRASQLAKLQEELANVRKQIKEYDEEAEIGRYKFLYDSDPSTLMSYRQNKRTAELTDKMRKATEAASKESNLQTAWKQNGIDREVARYDLGAAKTAFDEAEKAGDTAAMERALNELGRAQAKYNRVNRESDVLRNKLMGSLGVAERDEEKLDETAFDDSPYRGRIASTDAVKQLDGKLNLLDKKISVDNVAVDKQTKLANVRTWLSDIETAKKEIESSSLSTEQKNERIGKLADMEAKVRSYAKPKPNGGQPTKTTKEDYQKALDSIGSNYSRLVDKGYQWLVNARKSGATHPRLNDAIANAYGRIRK